VSRPPSADAPRIFTGIARSYDRAGAVFSFGQDPRWRHALVDAVAADADDIVLDVATGTGLVAVELAQRYGCRVVGLDRSADMLSEASRRNGQISGLVNARAERLPFADATFDHVTFTYLLRYVDDPATTVRELSRVLKPGGRIAAPDEDVQVLGRVQWIDVAVHRHEIVVIHWPEPYLRSSPACMRR